MVSGRLDKPVIHFEAPPAERVDAEINAFIARFNESRDNAGIDPFYGQVLPICGF